MTRILVILIICLFLSGCSSYRKEYTGYTISGQGQGKNGPIHVELYIENDNITHIEVTKHSETPGFDHKMIALIDEILASGSLDVDVISGATITSDGLINAVQDAYSKGDKLTINSKMQQSTIVNTDILIIGGGGAGFVAAIEALNLGNEKVTVIEKMPFGGGNARMSGGEYAAPNNWIQSKDTSIVDSPDLLFGDIMKASDYIANPNLVRILADNALDNALWLKDEVGVKYKDYQTYYGGHSVPRTLWPIGDGPNYIDTLIQKAIELNVDIHYNTQAFEFIIDTNNKVIGAKANYNDKTIEFYANNGVILTTGGFGANVDMRMFYDTKWGQLNSDIPTTNSPAIQGDGIKMALNINANLIDMEHIQLYPINNPATGNYYFMDYARLMSNALLVNKDGNRFVNEKETRNNIARSILKQKSTTIYEVIDQAVIDELNLNDVYKNEILRGLDQGVLCQGSLQYCSDFFELPYENILNTINKYNEYAINGYDEDFNRTQDLRPLSGTNYIMFSSIVSVHYTMGGVQINENAEVLNTQGEVIDGLYAAGEVTGGIHGADRLGSLSIPDTVTFARIAARNAISKN